MRRWICICSVLLALAVTVYYLHLGESLLGNASALSKTGLTHPIWFAAWGLTTYFALTFNLAVAYARTKHTFHIPLLATAFVGMVLTLTCDFDYAQYPQYLAHCIGTLLFSVLTGLAVFLLFWVTKRRWSAAITTIVLLLDFILLLRFKETALIELVPIFTGYVLLLRHNLRGERVRIEAK